MAALTGSNLIHSQLNDIGIKVVSGLRGDQLISLMVRMDQDTKIVQVRVALEPEAADVCGGAFFGGTPALMGIAGLLACGVAVFGPHGY